MIKRRVPHFTAGFTLLELSIVLAILALLIGGGLVVGTAQMEQKKVDITKERLDTIEATLKNFVTAYQRLPCPADITLPVTDADFGKENRTAPNNCHAVSGAIFSSGDVFGSAIPVRSLQLPDDYIADGWGRRFLYVVDQRATENNSFDVTTIPAGTASALNFSGAIAVDNINGTCTTPARADPGNNTGAVVLVLSYGQDGHGAWPKSGGAASVRIDTGSTQSSQLENAEIGGAFNACFIQADRHVDNPNNAATTTFDDIVRYKLRFQFAE